MNPIAKETILILDEESHVQWTLKILLEKEKYNVIPVSTIRMAVQDFLEFEVSGLITEYRIQRSCTLEAIGELKKRFPEAYVMILTHYDVEENEYGKIMDAGIDDFFLKLSSSEKILLHLRKGQKDVASPFRRNDLKRNWLKSIQSGYLETHRRTEM